MSDFSLPISQIRNGQQSGDTSPFSSAPPSNASAVAPQDPGPDVGSFPQSHGSSHQAAQVLQNWADPPNPAHSQARPPRAPAASAAATQGSMLPAESTGEALHGTDEVSGGSRGDGEGASLETSELARWQQPGSAGLKQKADAGLVGGGQPLPHLDAIQRSFGRAFDLSGVRAYIGGPAQAAARESAPKRLPPRAGSHSRRRRACTLPPTRPHTTCSSAVACSSQAASVRPATPTSSTPTQ